ncbi:Uncharacterised protein [Clostridium baratii]|uniref:hypothetical protein n=1 Tax=Clostridium baratii TaxID=1561 RepID=UPI0006C11AB2|nr:hypothetical protein [Clostridium baratii]CUP24972.1 Uncharacterised protein [Clostridium baratii]
MRNNKTFNEIHNEFKKYKESNHEARKIKEIYERVEMEYKENKNLDIALEKIMVKRNLEEYMPWTLDYYCKIFVVILTIFISNVFSVKDNLVLLAVEFIFTIAIIFIFMFFIDRKSIRKESSKHIYYSICLDVLNKLEDDNL